MVSKEEYVKNHMKMSLGVKIAIIFGLAAMVAAVVLVINLYPRMQEIAEAFFEWLEMFWKYDEHAGDYTGGFILLFLSIAIVGCASTYISSQKKKLGEYHYNSYCEYKKRERKFVTETKDNEVSDVADA